MPQLNLRQKILQKVLLRWGLISRGMTLGVRAIVADDDRNVLLVKHTYVPGWYLPGGAIDAGEHAFDAVEREVFEESGIRLKAPPQPISLYLNAHASARDHVMLFFCPSWERTNHVKIPNREIVAAEFFNVDKLPDDTTDGTRRRLMEWHSKGDPTPIW